MSQEIAEIAEKKRCPGLNNCGHIKPILSQDWPFEDFTFWQLRRCVKGATMARISEIGEK